MGNKLLVAFAAPSVAGFCLAASSLLACPNTETLRGWLSDEQCAKGRAESGKFTAANPDCAHKSVGEGKKVVLVDPVGKQVLTLMDQVEAKKNLGNYVEISGPVDNTKGTFRADSIKFRDRARPMREVPTKPKATNP